MPWIKSREDFATDMFSVIIPALNEEACISRTLQSIPDDDKPVEVIVADGGSCDATRRLAEANVRVIEAPQGRARQMNAAAALAVGDILVFVHADTILPNDAFARIRFALRDGGHEAGAFRLIFDQETPLLRFYGSCTKLPLPQICFGDRALFVQRDTFDEVGGFPDIPIFEDLEMVRMLHRRGRFAFLRADVTTSSRRFLDVGPLRQQLRNTYLWLHFMLRTDPGWVARHYPYDDDVKSSRDIGTPVGEDFGCGGAACARPLGRTH